MRLAAAIVAAATVAVAPGASASGTPVLGFDYTAKRLAWFDASTLAPLAGRKVAVRTNACSWAFSRERAMLAYTDCEGSLTIVNARTMRAAGTVYAAGHEGVAWLGRDRVVTSDDDALAVADVARKRIVRRIELPGRPWGRTVLPDGRVVYAVTNPDGFGPARVAVLEPTGTIRLATLDRIVAGAVFDTESGDPTGAVRQPGFAVDTDGGRAFVVAPDLLVAEVDLTTLEVRYHGATRALAKAVSGPWRYAYWLGDGLLAVGGTDSAIAGNDTVMTPFGLHVIDTRTWTSRTIDAAASWAQFAAGLLVVTQDRPDGGRDVVAWDRNGTARYRLTLASGSWPMLSGHVAYVCDRDRAVRMINASTGATTATLKNRACVQLLDAASSTW